MNIGELITARAGLSVPGSGTVTTTYMKAADTQGLGLVNSSGTSVVTVSDAGLVTFKVNSLIHVYGTATGSNSYNGMCTADDYGRMLFGGGSSISNSSGAWLALVGNSNTDYGANTGGAIRASLGNGSSATFTLLNSSDATIISGTAAGAWTFGPSTHTGVHVAYGAINISNTGSTYQLSLERTSTSTSKIYFGTVSTSNLNVGTTAGGTEIMQISPSAVKLTGMPIGAGTYPVKWAFGGILTYDNSYSKLKNNIRDSVYGLSEVLRLRSRQFEYKDSGRSDVGFVAEEVHLVIPELTPLLKESTMIQDGTDELVPAGVNYDRMTSVLVKAVQELSAKLDAQEAMLADANARIATLEAK